MKNKFCKGVIIGLIIVLPWVGSQAWATDYYVRPAGGDYGAENGLSYATAWDGFANVNWTTVDTGNGKLFVGGTHAEGDTVAADGEEGVPIYIASCTIANGASDDDPGTVQGRILMNRDYVAIDGLTVENSTGHGFELGGSNYVTIQNCIIQGNDGDGIGYWEADPVADGNGIIIQDNIIQNNGDTAGSREGIFFKGTDIIIRRNTIINNGAAGTVNLCHGIYIDYGTVASTINDNIINGHTKGCGIRLKGNSEVYNNKIYTNEDAGIGIGQNSTFDIVNNIYNNVIYDNGDHAISELSKGTGSITLSVINNSTYFNGTAGESSWFCEIYIGDDISPTIKNNIFHTGAADYTYSVVSQTAADIDYNTVYRASDSHTYYDGGARTWAYWQGTLGFDTHGLNTDPLFNDAAGDDFTLQAGSPCCKAGTHIQGYTTKPSWVCPDITDCDYWIENYLTIGVYPCPFGAAGM